MCRRSSITVLFTVNDRSIAQSLAKLTANFQSSFSIGDPASEVANSAVPAGDSCSLQQYCDTGCQTDIMGEVGAPPDCCLQSHPPVSTLCNLCIYFIELGWVCFVLWNSVNVFSRHSLCVTKMRLESARIRPELIVCFRARSTLHLHLLIHTYVLKDSIWK